MQANDPGQIPYFSNVFYTLSHPDYPNISLACGSSLNPHETAHLHPIIYLLLPIYMLYPSITTMFALQIFIIASGAIAVYFIMKFFNQTNLRSISISFFYIFNPFTTSYIFREFRFLPLGIPFFLFSYLFYRKKNFYLFTLFALLACACREEISFLYVFFPIFCDTHKNKILKFLPSCIGILWYVIAYKIIYLGTITDTGNIISHDLSSSWVFNISSHTSFIYECFTILATYIDKPQIFHYYMFVFVLVFSLFSFKKPLSFILLYIICFFASFQANIIETIIINTSITSAAYYASVAYIIMLINFLTFTGEGNKTLKKNIILTATIILGFATTLAYISHFSDRPNDIGTKEVYQLSKIIDDTIGIKNNQNTIITVPSTSSLASTHPYVFNIDHIVVTYPNILLRLRKTKFLILRKDSIPSTIDTLLKTNPHTKTETDHFMVIKMENYLDTSFLLSKQEKLFNFIRNKIDTHQ